MPAEGLPPLKRALLIVNPISGQGFGRTALPRIRRGARSLGLAVETYITRQAGDARRWVEQGAGDTDAIISVGGDGTLNEVINGLGDRRTPVVLMPAGTGNILGKELRCPSTAEMLLDVLRERLVLELDLCEVRALSRPPASGTDGLSIVPTALDVRRFVCVAGVGFDAEIVRAMSQTRQGAIHIAHYTIPILKVLRQYDFPPLEVEIDGRRVSHHAGVVIVGNVRSYGGPLQFTPMAARDDGLLDVCIFEKRSVRDLLRYAVGVITRSHLRFPDVRYFRGQELRVYSSRVRVSVQADGDNAGFLPARIRVIPQALRLLVSQKQFDDFAGTDGR